MSRVNSQVNFLNYIFVFILILFILEILLSNIDAEIRMFKDSAGYLNVSKVNFFSVKFWFASRPIGYPLILKLLSQDIQILVGVQILFSIISWSTLAAYLYLKSLNKFIGFTSAIFVFLIAVSPDISSWNYNVLTESFTFSCLPLVFVFTLEYIKTNKNSYLFSLLLLLGFFSTLRDINAYYVLSFIIMFTVLYLSKRMTKRVFIPSLLFLFIVFFSSTYSAEHANPKPRWLYSYYNLVGQRFLSNDTIVKYMEAHGMLINNTLLAKQGFWAGTGNKEGIGFYTDPKLKDFRDFVKTKGKKIYMKYLLTHPCYSFGQIWEHRNEIFHLSRLVNPGYYPKGYKTGTLFNYSNIRNMVLFQILCLLIILLTVISFKVNYKIYNKNTLPIITLLLPIVLLSIISFHGDAMEVGRHALIVPILIKLTLSIIYYILGNEYFLNKHKVLNRDSYEK